MSEPLSGASASSSRTSSRMVADSEDISRVLRRLAHQVVENVKDVSHLVIMGIPTRGVPIAVRLAKNIGDIEKISIPVGSLDVTLFRDDLQMRPSKALEQTRLPAEGIDGKTVILVDDVLFSGRTIRAALDAINEYGRPAVVQLAVLVDRGHRELPIRADYVGKNLPTSLSEKVAVQISEIDSVDQVVIQSTIEQL
ncbi:bifunctional pyr operon transcriptional regulator/uracil phosphoribosyltransferase PyrR [Actinomycetota bacterium]|nr:bifunctional pyr operon transcriptional regulator/uracil phosphoribosyltransferase PyrR [Actinomycetota bacterium]MDB9920645.1 bifunctional pyr operon transcriptional regulator/uracil phosphoribosyltransferase PyrR [Actinomycetota bacterium]